MCGDKICIVCFKVLDVSLSSIKFETWKLLSYFVYQLNWLGTIEDELVNHVYHSDENL